MRLQKVIPGTVALWQLQSDFTDSSGNGLDLSPINPWTGAATTAPSLIPLPNRTNGVDTPDPDILGVNFTNIPNVALKAPLTALLQFTGACTFEWLMTQQATYTGCYMCCAGASVRTPGAPDQKGSLYTLFSTGNPWVSDQYMGSNLPTAGYGLFPGYNDSVDHAWSDTGEPQAGDFHPHHYAYRRDSSGHWTVFRDGVTVGAGVNTAGTNVAGGSEVFYLGSTESQFPFPSGTNGIAVYASVRVLNYARSDTDIAADASYAMGTTFPGTRTTAEYIADYALHDPFYYLKITGLPYYFFSVIDPTDAKWGDAQWTLGPGYTSVKGMDVPDSEFSQQLNDIIGGIATAERARLQMMDFNVVDANGQHSFFGRLLSPGRISGSSAATIGYLQADLHAAADVGDTMSVVGSGGAFAAVDTYIGGETIGISSVATSGPASTLTIEQRNKYPCTAGYPAKPYYHVITDSSGSIDNSSIALVTQGDPISFIGRSAALYIGHMTPDGRPEPESNALCRMVGHIRGVGYGSDPGKYTFDIESVVADINAAIIAPGLAHAEILPKIYLPTNAWRTLLMNVSIKRPVDGTVYSYTGSITLPSIDSFDSPKDLEGAIQVAFRTLGRQTISDPSTGFLAYVWFSFSILDDGNGGSNFQLIATVDSGDTTLVCSASFDYPWVGLPAALNGSCIGLLSALGFPASPQSIPAVLVQNNTTTTQNLSAVAPRQPPLLFVPTAQLGGPLQVLLAYGADAAGDRFFSDQGDGSGVGWVRYGDGQVVQCTAHAIVGSQMILTVGENSSIKAGAFGPLAAGQPAPTSYYVEDLTDGQNGTVDQVVHIPSKTTASAQLALFQLLASNGNSNDAEFNVFPEGVGLGLDGLLDKDSIRLASFAFTSAYAFDVDATTTFGELWAGISKLLGMFIVWDPAKSEVALRQLTLPNPALATKFVLSESNRSSTGDRSQVQVDTSYLRTGWTIRHGWDYAQRKFTSPEIHIVDNYAISAYQIASRVEVIEDRLLPSWQGVSQQYIDSLSGNRSIFTRYPWAKATRSVNKTGMLLSPGLYVQIIDNTMINSFTGNQGIQDTDFVFGFIVSVKSTLIDGEVQVGFIVDQTGDSLRPWSPTGLVDFSATANGYNNTTGVVTLAAWYTNSATANDGIDFLVGDKVYLTTRSNDGAPGYLKSGTVSAVAADGSTVTIDAGLGALSTTIETIMILQDWSAQTTARKTGNASRVTFQGDGVALLIAGTARLEKWT